MTNLITCSDYFIVDQQYSLKKGNYKEHPRPWFTAVHTQQLGGFWVVMYHSLACITDKIKAVVLLFWIPPPPLSMCHGQPVKRSQSRITNLFKEKYEIGNFLSPLGARARISALPCRRCQPRQITSVKASATQVSKLFKKTKLHLKCKHFIFVAMLIGQFFVPKLLLNIFVIKQFILL